MKKVFILKIGSFIEPEKSNGMGLNEGEPRNFGKLLSTLGYEVWLASNQKTKQDDLNYFDLTVDNFNMIEDFVKKDDIVLLWQGETKDLEVYDIVVQHYRFLNQVQQSKATENQFFMITDTRMPLYNIHKIMSEHKVMKLLNCLEETKIDPKQITILNQAYKHYEYLADLGGLYNQYAYQNFKSSEHLEMHLMPLFTHTDFNPYNHKSIQPHDLVFSANKISNFDDYRMSRLYKLVLKGTDLTKYDLAIYGNHDKKSIERLMDVFEEKGHTNIHLPKLMSSVNFNDFKYVLRNSKANLCISEENYVKYDLLPNRIFESFATGCIPLIDYDILKSTSNNIVHDFCENYMHSIKSEDYILSSIKAIDEHNLRQNSLESFKKILGYKNLLTDSIKRLFN